MRQIWYLRFLTTAIFKRYPLPASIQIRGGFGTPRIAQNIADNFEIGIG